MVSFGIVSSVFDYLTFFLLLFVLKLEQTSFRTGWFIESVLTELLALLILRTNKPFFRSKVGKGLLVLSVLVAILTVSLAYIPKLNTLLGLTPIPLNTLMFLVLITIGYVAANEFIKWYFYRRTNSRS